MRSQAGFTLIEVLITFLIIAIGLLGLAGLQTSTINNQFEAYQRGQITTLLDDMAGRLRGNAAAAKSGDYTGAVTTEYGQQVVATCNATVQSATRDLCECNRLLAGAAATNGLSAAPLNARGCIDMVTASGTHGETVIRVAIAWQGLTESAEPSDDCGSGDFGDETFRRVAFRDVILR